jgi:hypothetical protein
LLKIILSISTWPNKYAMHFLRSKSETNRGSNRSRCNSSKKCSRRLSNRRQRRRDSRTKKIKRLKVVPKRKYLRHPSRRRTESQPPWEPLQVGVRPTANIRR